MKCIALSLRSVGQDLGSGLVRDILKQAGIDPNSLR